MSAGLGKLSEGTVLHLEDFAPLVGEEFIFARGSGERQLRAELVVAESLGGAPAALEGARAPFRLEFRFPPSSDIGQATFDLDHPSLGSVAVFLVPREDSTDGWMMDTIFN